MHNVIQRVAATAVTLLLAHAATATVLTKTGSTLPFDPAGISQCRDVFDQRVYDLAAVATEDPAATFANAEHAQHRSVDVTPAVECASRIWRALRKQSGLRNAFPGPSTLALRSGDPAADLWLQPMTARTGTNIALRLGGSQYTTSIAVNPADLRQLAGGAGASVVYVIPACLSPTGDIATFTGILFGSTDGGDSWKITCAPWPASVTGPPGAVPRGSWVWRSADPVVAWDGRGNAYVAYRLVAQNDYQSFTSYSAIAVARSSDGGQSWSPLGVVVNNFDGTGFNDKERLAIDTTSGPASIQSHPDRLYVVWDKDNSERVAHSDDGVNWTTVVLPVPGFGNGDLGTDIKVGADGAVYVIWNRFTAGTTLLESIVFSRSVDGGTTWSQPVTVTSLVRSGDSMNSTLAAQDIHGVNAFGSLDVDRNPASPYFGSLYVAYCDGPAPPATPPEVNVYIRRSMDGGSTWSAPVKANDDTGGADQFLPSLSVDQSDGTVNISWYDTRIDPVSKRKTQVYYGRSSNGGASFEPNLRVTDDGSIAWQNPTTNYSDESSIDNEWVSSSQYGDSSGCAAANRQVHPMWTDSRQFYPVNDPTTEDGREDAATATIANCTAPWSAGTPVATTSCASPRVSLSWAPVSFWGINATGGVYTVYRSTSPLFPGGAPLVSNLTGTTFDDTSGRPGWTYYYFVVATNNCPGTILTPMSAPPSPSAAVLFPACGTTLGTLSGHVTVNGIPVAGSTVTAGTISTTTDGTGAYAMPIGAGTYGVAATAAGYDAASQNGVTIAGSATTTVDFQLTPSTGASCSTDDSQSDFLHAASAVSADLTSNPGSVILAASSPSVYQPAGTLVSAVKDGGLVPGAALNWITLSWSAATPPGTTIRFQAAACDSPAGPFAFVGPDGTAATFFTNTGASLAQFNGHRYLQYAAWLATTNPAVTPSLDSVTICHQAAGCSGATATITPSASQSCPYAAGLTATAPAGAAAYTWSIVNGTITSGAAAQTVTFTSGPSGATTLILLVTMPTGCSAGSAAEIAIQTSVPTPVITASGDTTICPGDSVVLTSSSSTANQWYLNGVAIAGATGPSYAATASGDYTVTNTPGSCSSSPSAAVTVTWNHQPEQPFITHPSPTGLCEGDSTRLYSSAPADNQWFLNGVAIGGATAPQYDATLSGDYSVWTAPAGGCPSPRSTPVTIHVYPHPPKPSITASGPTTFCDGDSVTLTSSSPTGNQWTTLFGSVWSYDQSINVHQTVTLTDYVTINGCSTASDPTTITVAARPAAPVITAGGPLNICAGSSVTLSSNYGTGNQWSLNGTPITGATGQTYAASTAGTYSVTETQGACGAASAPVTVSISTVPPTPSISAAGPTTFCQGGSVTLSATGSGPFQWYFNGAPRSQASSLVASQTGSYTVVTYNGSCPSAPSSPMSVQVNPVPAAPTVTTTGSPLLCPGNSVTFTSSMAAGNQWYKDGVAIPGATAQSYIATTTGQYSVQAMVGPCPTFMSIGYGVVLITPPPKPVITAGSTIICGTRSVTLHSSMALSWYRDGVPLNWISTSYDATQPGSYQVFLSNVSQCGTTQQFSDPVVVTSLAMPSAAITTTAWLTTGTNGTASIAAVSGATYQWTITNGTFSGSTAGPGVAFTAGGVGTLSLKATVTNAGGCADTKTVSVLVTPIPGQEKFDPNGDATIDPADVFYLVNYLFTQGPAPHGTAGAVASGDANGDGVVDPADVFYLVNYLFTSGPHTYSHLAGTSIEPRAGNTAEPELRGSVTLGTPTLRDGRYLVPVIVSTGTGSAQAVAVKIHLDGVAAVTAIHRAAALAGAAPAFETVRETEHEVSYLASYGAGTKLDGIVAEVELDSPSFGRIGLTLDPAVTLLSNSTGTLKASAGDGTLSLHGNTISIDRPARAKDPQ